MPSSHRLRGMGRKGVVVLAVLLLAAACSGGDEATTTVPTTVVATTLAPTTTTVPPTTTTTTLPPTTTTTLPPPPVSALNGLPAEDPVLLERRVVAVKVDNHSRARPQSGLQAADAVIELRVEGGITRFIALFHDNDSTLIGPVRSGRPTDATILKVLGAPFQISGGQLWVREYIENQGVNIIGEGPATSRLRRRSAPHNLYTSSEQIRLVADNREWSDEPPGRLYTIGKLEETDGEATEIRMKWSNGNTVTWKWDGEHYLRFLGNDPHEYEVMPGERGQLAFDLLVVIKGKLISSEPPEHRPGGNPVPGTITTGVGDVIVFANGTFTEGRWAREGFSDQFKFTRPDGSLLPVPPGTPWINIFPDSQDIVWE